MAEPGSSTPDKACQTTERKLFKDIREHLAVDLDAATDAELEALGTQLLTILKAESLPVSPPALDKHLRGTGDLRAFLKAGLLKAWSIDLRISVTRTLSGGPNVKAAAQRVLAGQSIDVYLAFLNDGLYAARALDCASPPTGTPSATATVRPSATTSVTPSATVVPSATETAAPVPSSSAGAAGGEGGGRRGRRAARDGLQRRHRGRGRRSAAGPRRCRIPGGTPAPFPIRGIAAAGHARVGFGAQEDDALDSR